MAEVLLTSEAFVKSATGLRDNLAGAYLLPSIREAQEAGLRPILGDALTERLKEMVRTGDVGSPENTRYRELLDRCQYYLAYAAVSEAAMRVTLKIGNFGVARSSDEHLEPGDGADVAKVQEWWQDKADGCCLRLQEWLLVRRAEFPELTEAECGRLKANLRSAASCGIWLGGPRGKMSR